MTKIVNSEEYKLIPIENNYHYYVSKDGKCYSKKSNKVLKPILNGNGYYTYGLTLNKFKMISAHRLVALTYIKNTNNKTHINHIDGNKLNNNVNNLEWVTCQENIQHAYDTGLKSNKGDKHPMNKLTEADVLYLREYYNNNKVTYRELAKKYNVRDTTISKAIRGISFSHI